jgi:hypothetical protein
MEVAIGPDNPAVYLYNNGRSLGVDTEVRILVVTEVLVVIVDMVVLVVTLVKVVMVVMVAMVATVAMVAMVAMVATVATVQLSSHLLDSLYGFTWCFFL